MYVGRVVQVYIKHRIKATLEFGSFGQVKLLRIFSCLDEEMLRQDHLQLFCCVPHKSQKDERLAVICTRKITKYEGVYGREIITYFYSPRNCS